MLLPKNLFLRIFNSAYMERWNDKLRPLPFYEIDKQAHKMMIAYFLGTFSENEPGFDWRKIIEGGIFEQLQRTVITDIKPPVYRKIKADKEKFAAFNEWICSQLREEIEPVGEDFIQRFSEYFADDNDDINRKILRAAHIYSSKWEFDIIERTNPNGYDMDLIRREFDTTMEECYDLEGIKQLALYKSYRQFIDLCGQLRFQIRWANLYRIPKTSVLGHSLFVAVFSYLFSLMNGFDDKRLYNNYFTGLFHDLPEVLTRDIISPVKKSVEGLADIIKEYEREQMNDVVYPLVTDRIHSDLQFWTEDEFCTVDKNGTQRDGCLVKGIDELSAYIEALIAVENGSNSPEFKEAIENLKFKYKNSNPICNVDFHRIFCQIF